MLHVIFSSLLIAITLLLSMRREKMKLKLIIFSSCKMSHILMILHEVSETVIYSVLVMNRDTSVCLIKCQYTDSPAIFIRDSVVDLQSDLLSAQFMSV